MLWPFKKAITEPTEEGGRDHKPEEKKTEIHLVL